MVQHEGRRPREVFVGREAESRRIIKSIENGTNVVLRGRYGIGKTALASHVAHRSASRIHFVRLDFSRTNATVCRSLLVHLSGSTDRSVQSLSASRVRSRIARWKASNDRRVVLVLDNLAKITRPRLGLMRDWVARDGFLIMALVEESLSRSHLDMLRQALIPQIRVDLGPLPPARVRDYLARTAAVPGTERSRELHARACGGHPLAMVEMARRSPKVEVRR